MPDERYTDDDYDRGRRDDPPRRYDDEDDDRGRRFDRGGYGGEEVPNYLVQSILVTLFCCVPFGIVALVNAAKVNSLVASGDYRAARQASDDAKKWCTIGFTLGLIANILVFGLQFMAIMAGGM